MTDTNRASYLRSLSQELDVQASRVRELIGSRHWASDGTHKEALLGGLLQRHLPAGHIVSRGFVTSESDPNVCSKEQDLVIVDTMTEAPAFCQNGLIVVFPQQVRAAVSVKSGYSSTVLKTALADLSTVAAAGPPIATAELWLGLYFFSNSSGSTQLSALLDAVGQAVPGIARRAAIAEYVIRVSSDIMLRCSFSESRGRAVAYQTPELATSCFLARLLTWLAAKRNGTASFDTLLADLDVTPSQSEELDF